MQQKALLIRYSLIAFAGVLSSAAPAYEVTVKNDSATDGSQATPCLCFDPGEEAAAWLTSPCDGDIVAVQVLMKSEFGGKGSQMETAIRIYGDGTFPTPGSVLTNATGGSAVISAPTMEDEVFNEYRYLDPSAAEPQTPLSVAVSTNDIFVVSLEYFNENDAGVGASTAWDDDEDCQSNRNAFQVSGSWGDLCTAGGDGDWVIRAIVDCEAGDIPATSSWGLVVLTILLLAGGVVYILRKSTIRERPGMSR